MAEIRVQPSGTDEWRVEVSEEASSTTHQVTVTQDDLDQFGGDVTPEAVIEESFRFLLEREPKESILPSFALPVIARYFPEYPEEIHKRLRA